MEGIIFLLALLVLGVMTAFLCERKNKREQMEKIKKEYGKKPERQEYDFSDIAIYYELMREQREGELLDEITWNDLEMDRIFARLNSTQSYLGEQKLYCLLHEKKNEQDFVTWERHINFFEKEEEERQKLQYKLAKIGKNHEDYYLPLFLFQTEDFVIKHSFIYRVLQVLLFASLAIGIIGNSPIFLMLGVAVALLNLGIYAFSKNRYEAYLTSLSSVKHMMQLAKYMTQSPVLAEELDAKKTAAAVKELEALTRLIGNFQIKKSAVWTGDAMGILRDYVIGLTLWDFTVYDRITKIIRGKQGLLLQIYEYLGDVDAEIAIASCRKSLPEYCIPEWAKEKKIVMEGVYHPLIDAPVSNDLVLDQNFVITGSNAAGKSTFIKAAAINVILAQSIHTCMADKLELYPMRVITSMTVRDDVCAGESYYIRELKYLKRILNQVGEKAREGESTLCLVDEILRGTNKEERLSASQAVLQYLSQRNCIVIVATHDMELALALEKQYRCLSFENQMQGGNISFDYKLKEGYSRTKNAIALLRYIGFPDTIVTTAQKLYKEA